MRRPSADSALPQPRWLSASEQRAWRTYIDGSQRLMGLLNRDLVDGSGLTLADYRILVLLSESPDGSRRMSELADGVDSSRSRLTHQVKRLMDQGLVTRAQCEDDGRGVLAVLTPVGRQCLEAAAPAHVEMVRRCVVDVLSADQLRGLQEAFAAIEAAVQAAGA